MMIDVTPADYLKIPGNRGLVRMLQALADAGKAGLPTRKAGEQVFGSRQYGYKVLKKAEGLGYVERKKVAKPKGGYPYVMNRLTPAGRKLLQELGK